VLDLELFSAYLPHRAGRLVEHRRSGDERLISTALTASFEDAFELQLAAFRRAVRGEATVETPPEQARADMQAIQAAHAIAMERVGA
jgi:predicted dehydrogenase